MVKRVLIGCKQLKKKNPMKIPLPPKKKLPFLLLPYPLSNFHKSAPKRTHSKWAIFLVLTNLLYHESLTFKEWETIFQNERESLLIPDELFKWLILVFGLAKAKIKHQDLVPCLRIDSLTNLRINFLNKGRMMDIHPLHTLQLWRSNSKKSKREHK